MTEGYLLVDEVKDVMNSNDLKQLENLYLRLQSREKKLIIVSGWTLLHFTTWWQSNVEFTKFLIKKGEEVNARDNIGTTPLHNAAVTGSLEVVKLLLASGAKIDAKDKRGDTPLAQAKKYRRGISRLLMSKNKIYKDLHSQLQKVIALLLRHGAKE